NGPFGLGWHLDLASIERRTDKRLPTYEDADEADVFILSGVEDLVPALIDAGGGHWVPDAFTAPTGERVQRYRPRLDRDFSRVERITPVGAQASYWKVTTRENVATIYGRAASARLEDPAAPARVFRWLPQLSYDDKGNCIEYEYVTEDLRGVPD